MSYFHCIENEIRICWRTVKLRSSFSQFNYVHFSRKLQTWANESQQIKWPHLRPFNTTISVITTTLKYPPYHFFSGAHRWALNCFITSYTVIYFSSASTPKDLTRCLPQWSVKNRQGTFSRWSIRVVTATSPLKNWSTVCPKFLATISKDAWYFPYVVFFALTHR